MAQRRFLNLEQKLIRCFKLNTDYKVFMKEYVDLGHMTLAQEDTSVLSYYLPHHAVTKSDSITTKTRVVFDGSAVTSTGISLNDVMMRGATVQPDLIAILLRFRLHNIALTADIEKMYRQIRVHDEDCNLQKIFYRPDPNESLKQYKLMTVTYGTKSAPFLATRCLTELAKEADTQEAMRAIKLH